MHHAVVAVLVLVHGVLVVVLVVGVLVRGVLVDVLVDVYLRVIVLGHAAPLARDRTSTMRSYHDYTSHQAPQQGKSTIKSLPQERPKSSCKIF